MTDPTNEARQNSGRSILSHYRMVMKSKNDTEALVSLLTDLRHICHVRDGLWFDDAAQAAKRKFRREIDARKEKLS